MYQNPVFKLLFALLFVGTSISIDAQIKPKDNYYYWNYKNKPFYFGMTAGIQTTGFLIQKSSQFASNESINFTSSIDKPGINVNFISNLKMGEYFDFRFIPGFSYSEKHLEFKNPSGISKTEKIESFYIEVPLHLRFKSAPYKDKRLFVVGGLKYSYDVSSNNNVRDDEVGDLFLISPHDFQFEVGVGIQLFYPFFIFSPEIKFSQGIGNIHIFNGTKPESTIIDRILSRALTISFHVEG